MCRLRIGRPRRFGVRPAGLVGRRGRIVVHGIVQIVLQQVDTGPRHLGALYRARYLEQLPHRSVGRAPVPSQYRARSLSISMTEGSGCGS